MMYEKSEEPILSKLSKSYTEIYLFDDTSTMYNYVKK